MKSVHDGRGRNVQSALHLVVAGFDVGVLVRGRVVRVVRQVEAKALQFTNGSLQLRDGSADVGEFDDVRFRRFS